MPRLRDGRTTHVAGWIGGQREYAEPDTVDPRARFFGAVDDGLNLSAEPGGRLTVRHGSRVVRALSAVTGNAIASIPGIFRFSPTGGIVIAHSTAASKHYAYAMTDTMAFALPVGSATEAGSRVDLGWNTATAGRPQAVELFEHLYVVDASSTNRREMAELELSAGALVASIPVYDLDGSGAGTGGIKAYCIAAYNGVLFVAGWDSESGGLAPHMVRHSFLGRDPGSATGFDPDAYNIIGALNQPITAMVPGNSILLVAKQTELYRITGSGKAVSGWQYVTSQLDNTLGVGCTNPYALAYANGYWYGIGTGGPWRSDGQSVESLRGARERSWASVDSLSTASVMYDAERDKILFGIPETGQTVPRTHWKWDCGHENWDVNERTTRSFHQLCAIPLGVSQAAAGPPSNVVQSFSFADWRTNSITGTFTIGDTSAETEVWMYHASLPDALITTVDKGVSRFSITGIVLNYEVCYVRVRHKKAGVYTDFSGETACYPLLHTPQISAEQTSGGTRTISMGNYINNTLVQNLYGDSVGLSWDNTVLDAAAGTASDAFASNGSETYTAEIEQTAFAVGRELSNASTLAMTATTLGQPASLSAPSQDVTLGDLALTSLIVRWMPNGWSINWRVEYRLTGSGSGWTTGATYTSPVYPTALTSQSSTISGLNNSSKYDVRIAYTNSASTVIASSTVVMYTKLASPTISIAQGGAGTPDVDIDVTVPTFAGGYDVRVYNANLSYNQLHAAQSAGLHTYNSTAGTCGVGDRYYAHMTNSTWPAPFTHSDAVSDDIASPCA